MGPPNVSPLSPLIPARKQMAQTPVNKFDWITRLVTAHEHTITQQAIILAELQRQAADLQNKQVVEMAMLASYRDRNLVAEVDSLKRVLEHTSSKVQQLGTEGEQISSTAALKQGLLAADLERLKAQVSELVQAQQGIKAEVSRVVSKEMAGIKEALMEAMQHSVKAIAEELRGEIAAVRSESSAASSSVEAATLTSSSLAVKLRSHIQASAALVNGLSTKIDSISGSVDGLASNIDHLEGDSKKVKKHVVKLEKQVESLQTLGHVAVAADKALTEMRRNIEECVTSVRTAQAQHEDMHGFTQRVRDCEARIGSVAELASCTRTDLGSMAEGVAAALHQLSEAVRSRQASHPFQAPGSLLSSLLAPLPGPSPILSGYGSGLAGGGGAGRMGLPGCGHQPMHQAQAEQDFDVNHTEFGHFLAAFRARSHAAAAAGPVLPVGPAAGIGPAAHSQVSREVGTGGYSSRVPSRPGGGGAAVGTAQVVVVGKESRSEHSRPPARQQSAGQQRGIVGPP